MIQSHLLVIKSYHPIFTFSVYLLKGPVVKRNVVYIPVTKSGQATLMTSK